MGWRFPSSSLQEGCTEFPPSDISLVEGSIPIPRASWNGMVPGGMLKLLPLSLWLCIQYLGTTTLVETVSYCHNLVLKREGEGGGGLEGEGGRGGGGLEGEGGRGGGGWKEKEGRGKK